MPSLLPCSRAAADITARKLLRWTSLVLRAFWAQLARYTSRPGP